MNEAQYRQLVKNMTPRGLKRPLEEGALRRIVGAAEKDVKRRERARRALEKVLDADLYGRCQVTMFSGGALEIEAADRIVAARLLKMQQSLKRRLMRSVPGLRSLYIRQFGETGGPEEERSGAEALSE